jgi:hypothetical protein
MLKTKVDPEMYMKTKGQMTICPTLKTTFLLGCRPFYTKIHDFAETIAFFSLFEAYGTIRALRNVEI